MLLIVQPEIPPNAFMIVPAISTYVRTAIANGSTASINNS